MVNLVVPGKLQQQQQRFQTIPDFASKDDVSVCTVHISVGSVMSYRGISGFCSVIPRSPLYEE